MLVAVDFSPRSTSTSAGTAAAQTLLGALIAADGSLSLLRHNDMSQRRCLRWRAPGV